MCLVFSAQGRSGNVASPRRLRDDAAQPLAGEGGLLGEATFPKSKPL